MKNWILFFILINLLVMCDKAKINEINNTIQQADSLINKTKTNINTIDSIGKSLNLDSLNLPKIIKEKEKLENIYNDNKGAIDSLAAKISDFKTNIDKEKLQKQFDSLNAILTKTESRIKNIETNGLKVEKNNTPKNTTYERKINPLEKKSNIEINVENLHLAKQQLTQQLANANATITSENHFNDGEFSTIHFTTKVNIDKFDNLVDNIANNVGSVRNKNTEIKGSDYLPNTNGIIEITLYESLKPKETSQNTNLDTTPKSFSDKAWDAIKSGGTALGSIIILLLPFWPIAIIALIIYLIINRNKKKTQINNKDQSQD